MQTGSRDDVTDVVNLNSRRGQSEFVGLELADREREICKITSAERPRQDERSFFLGVFTER